MIKRSLRRFGIDVRRYSPVNSSQARFMAALSAHQVNLVFDVGANIGQFAEELRGSGYAGRIVSFEPLSIAWNQLVAKARRDPLWQVAPRSALGSKNGEAEMNIAGNLASSSVLKMLDRHVRVAPGTAYVGSELVPIRRLDEIGPQYVRPDSVLLIKADTQGFEREVLRGAGDLLCRTVGLHLELLLAPLYEGQAGYFELIDELRNRGFNLWGIEPGMTDPINGQLLQVDAIFFRS